MTNVIKPIDPTKYIIKVIVAGSRKVNLSTPEIKAHLSSILGDAMKRFNVVIVNGMARGPDEIGGEWATEQGLWQIFMPAPWEEVGKFAGHLRNGDMAQEGHVLLLFWDGESKGSTSMYNYALLNGLRVSEVLVTPQGVKTVMTSRGLDLWK